MSDTMDFDERASRQAEVMYLTRDLTEVRRRTIEALGLTPGMRVLDVGSGPGLFADEMAQTVGPTGCVRGVDISESMIGLARTRCADKPWVDFQIADAVSLPFEDEYFDACVSVQTLEFVADVDAALREIHRVLKPGGRLAVSDADWGATSWRCEDAALCERVMNGWLQGFAHLRLPLTLKSSIEAAGFVDVSARAIPVLNTACEPESFSFQFIRQLQGVVPARTDLTQEEVDAWASELRGLDERGAYFFSQTRYLFTADKPL
ncbi:MAG: methyltransferase domain-containing protein [Nitrospinae bacterium]|nr:methyltransferase domain-containing protein [Nitrospinota bacterium]MDE0330512.1 methyltransferase domain-containing protein [Nitrospinota bacterium]